MGDLVDLNGRVIVYRRPLAFRCGASPQTVCTRDVTHYFFRGNVKIGSCTEDAMSVGAMPIQRTVVH